jgi:energy-coupling factor transporter ATP-binding protein EcfA2
MALLQLERISAQYPDAAEPVLSDIYVSLGPQQLLVALRPSGSGKTSLPNLIAGFVEPSAGRITLDQVEKVRAPNAAWCSRTTPCCHGKTHRPTLPSGWSWQACPVRNAKRKQARCSPWSIWPGLRRPDLACDAARVHHPLALAGKRRGHVGQPRHPALRGGRLPTAASGDAPRDDSGGCAVLIRRSMPLRDSPCSRKSQYIQCFFRRWNSAFVSKLTPTGLSAKIVAGCPCLTLVTLHPKMRE